MNIKLMHSDPDPIYMQIIKQIKVLIMDGTLKPNDMLPSMRALASDLQISVITTKRAYEELEKEGFIHTVHGKGCFITDKTVNVLLDEYRRNFDKALQELIYNAKLMHLKQDEVVNLVCKKWSE